MSEPPGRRVPRPTFHETRRRAQRWFTEPGLVATSSGYDRRIAPPSASILVDQVLSDVEHPRTVLDAGCGSGDLLRLLARRLPESALLGIDPASEALTAARANLDRNSSVSQRCWLYALAAEDLADPSVAREWAAVDTVLVHLTLGLWPDAAEGLRALVSRLRPGGACFVLDLLRPYDEVAAAPYLAPARDDDEIRYLRDQMECWYTPEEVVRLADTVALASDGVTSRVDYSRFDGAEVDRADGDGPDSDAQMFHLLFRRSARC